MKVIQVHHTVGHMELKKAVQGTFHLGDTRFGETASLRCTTNAYFTIIFSAKKKVSLWKAIEINYILDKGDMLFKTLGINQPLAFNELPHVVNIEGWNIHTEFFLRYNDIFGYNNNLFEHIRNLDCSQTGNGAIFTCGGLSVSLIWGRNGVFLFDSHSRNIEGFPDPKSSAVFLEITLIRSLNNFLKRFYQVNVPNSFLNSFPNSFPNSNIDFEIDCQCHSKKTKFESYQQDEGNNIRTKQNEGYHQESSSNKSRKTKKPRCNENQLNMKGREANRVDKFTKSIMEGPVNIFIICNRCLYARSVLRSHQDKYDMDMDKVLSNVMQQEHICRTCDRHLKKQKIPSQAVCNKLNIPSVPCYFTYPFIYLKDFYTRQYMS